MGDDLGFSILRSQEEKRETLFSSHGRWRKVNSEQYYKRETKIERLREGPLENLWGGGRSTKKIFAQGKIK